MAAGDKWKCTAALSLWVKSSPTGDNLYCLLKNDIVTELDRPEGISDDDNWVYHDGGSRGAAGWSGRGGGKYLVKISAASPITEVKTTVKEEEVEIKYDEVDSGIDIDWLTRSISAQDVESDNNLINTALGVIGLPYQFMPHVDLRIGQGSNESGIYGLGEVWSSKIYSCMPLLLMTPGKAKFLPSYSKNERQNIIARLIGRGLGQDTLQDMLNKTGRYYSFEACSSEYYNYVNTMCRIAAVYLGVDKVRIPSSAHPDSRSEPLGSINWKNYTAHGVKSFADVGSMGAVGFYVESGSISESFSNSTTSSQMASIVNGIGDQGRELNFLFGYGASALDVNSDVMSNIENIKETALKLTQKKNIIGTLASHAASLAAGGRLVFPEIWADSNFSRSYNVSMKLISPDSDNVSLFLNILMPLMHLLGFAAPRSHTSNSNTYFQPFLVRAIYKGLFSVDTGIISDLSIEKGDGGNITVNGVPTTVNVSFSIKDLYDNMSITKSVGFAQDIIADIFNHQSLIDNSSIKGDINNTALMDYIGNACGINIFEPDFKRSLEMWYVMHGKNAVRDIVQLNIWGKLTDHIQNSVLRMYTNMPVVGMTTR